MMKKTVEIFLCSIILSFVLSCNKTAGKDEKTYSEKIEDWILPTQDNYVWFDYKMSNDDKDNVQMKRKIYFFKLDDSSFGTLEATFVNGIMGSGESRLFEIDQENKSVYLMKSKHSYNESEKEYDKLTYFQFPADDDTIRWSYSKNDGIFNCSSFWLMKTNKEKELVVVREQFQNNGSSERFEKDIEYYEKKKGLVKVKMFGSKDNLLMTQIVSERGNDGEALPEKFPLISSQSNLSFDKKKENSLMFLKKFDGKYSTEINLLNNSILQNRLVRLLGKDRYNLMKETWAVEGGIIVKNDIFEASGCEQHNCDMTNFIILVNLKKDLLYVGYRLDGKVQLFGENNTYPQKLIEFEKQY